MPSGIVPKPPKPGFVSFGAIQVGVVWIFFSDVRGGRLVLIIIGISETLCLDEEMNLSLVAALYEIPKNFPGRHIVINALQRAPTGG